MHCKILAVGKLKEAYLKDGILEYQKRLRPVFPVELAEVPDQPIPEKASAAEAAQAMEREGEALLRQLDGDTLVVTLEIGGKALSSEEFAAKMTEWSFGGTRKLAFVIGGSCGLSPRVRQRSDFAISFGRLTYPHQLMRLILMEQIYRSVKINRNEPYHK